VRESFITFSFLTNSHGSVLIDIDLAARTGTIRFLLHVLGEGPIELSPLLASVFLRIIDDPQSRKYIRVGTDLEVGTLIFPSQCA
jgi:hypothetical protein